MTSIAARVGKPSLLVPQVAAEPLRRFPRMASARSPWFHPQLEMSVPRCAEKCPRGSVSVPAARLHFPGGRKPEIGFLHPPASSVPRLLAPFLRSDTRAAKNPAGGKIHSAISRRSPQPSPACNRPRLQCPPASPPDRSLPPAVSVDSPRRPVHTYRPSLQHLLTHESPSIAGEVFAWLPANSPRVCGTARLSCHDAALFLVHTPTPSVAGSGYAECQTIPRSTVTPGVPPLSCRSLGRTSQLISHAPHRVYQPRTESIVDFLPKVVGVHIDDVGPAVEG